MRGALDKCNPFPLLTDGETEDKNGCGLPKGQVCQNGWSWADTRLTFPRPSPPAAPRPSLTLRLGVVQEGVRACFWGVRPARLIWEGFMGTPTGGGPSKDCRVA